MPSPKSEELSDVSETLPPPSVIMDAQIKERFDAYKRLLNISTEGTVYGRLCYYTFLVFDQPVSWFREKVVLPMRAKYGHWPYYHRKFGKGPPIYECEVNDLVCQSEANMQYKFDLIVDTEILNLLRDRLNACELHYGNLIGVQRPVGISYQCAQVLEDYEENELNHFIKYGELGHRGDVLTAYMKQKHRLIWERRHPQIMEERRQAVEAHKNDIKEKGLHNFAFWKSSWRSDWEDRGNLMKQDVNLNDQNPWPGFYDSKRAEAWKDDFPSPIKRYVQYEPGVYRTFLDKWFKPDRT